MGVVGTALLLLACALTRGNVAVCQPPLDAGQVAGVHTPIPKFTGTALDVVLSAQAALVWDMQTGTILYEKNADTHRPVASLSKLATVITVRSMLPRSQTVEIPSEVRTAQRLGANIKLPVGQHTTVDDLLSASLIASANDAAVSLAIAASGSEEAFVDHLNKYIVSRGLTNTKLANATGLSGGDQYSTAKDVMRALQIVYRDPALHDYLSSEGGTLHTFEGASRTYKTTDKLLGTYLPILAAKTGYTVEAGENLAIITVDKGGHELGAVVLGSEDRFQDMKVLVEWIWRNYTWPQ